MATAIKVPEANAKTLLRQAGVKVSKSDEADDLAKKLKTLLKKDEEDLDLDKKSRKLFAELTEAKKFQVVGVEEDDDEDEEEDEEEEEAPKKRGGRKAKASENGKATKKKGGKKRSSSGGPTTKDQVFELWLKDPKNAVKKAIAKFGSGGTEGAQDTTIRHWISSWRRATSFACSDGFPRAGAGRKKEILAAQKAAKKSKKDDE